MNATCLMFGIVFVLAGIALASGKLIPHMKVWKNMSEEERAGIRMKALCLNLGLMVSLCGVIFLTAGIWEAFLFKAFSKCMLAWFVLCVIDFWRINKGSRYKIS